MRVPNRSNGLSLLVGASVAALVVVFLVSERVALAQTLSPAASPQSVACDIEPRTDQDLEHLSQMAATPAGDPGEGTIDDTLWDEGVAADEETKAEIETTFALIDACSAAGDVSRLLALFTDDYIVREVLATEPVPIVPGTPDPSTSAGTPEAAETLTTVLEVRILPDGRAAAQVQRDGHTEMVILVEVEGRWLVDAVSTQTGGDGTPEAGVPDELAALPPVQAAVADAAGVAGVPVSDVTVTGVEPTVWPDSSLGCPQPDQFYAQVETPGYVVTLDVGGTEVTYHTDEGEAVVPCEAGGS